MNVPMGGQVSRRDFLRVGAAAAASLTGLRGLGQEPAKKRIPIALQLYSVREDCAKDLPGVLEAVAKMGYEGVEFAGFYGKKAEELRSLLDSNGLKAISSHSGLNALEGNMFDQTVAFHKTIGAGFIVVPGLPDQYTKTRQGWLDAAKKFNELSARLKEHQLRIGYHNHSAEFKALEGELPWDTFFSNTENPVVHQMDTGNCMAGGGDPIGFLKKYAGRTALIHLKEHGGPGDFGQGDCPWDEVFALCESTAGTEWYVVEQENYTKSPLECVKQCMEFLRGKGKAKPA